MRQLAKGTTLDSFEQLEAYLSHWRSFSDQQVYDPNGMMALFCACITNLRANVQDKEIDDLGAILTDEERDFLLSLISSRRT
jgi:hypothetical protein